MQTLLITLAVLMAVSIALRALQTATPAAVKQVLMRAGGGMLLAAAVAMLARGMTPFFALTTALLGAWLLFDLGTALSGQMSGTPNAGQVSRVTTDHLEMELDHDSGAMRGRGCASDSSVWSHTNCCRRSCSDSVRVILR